MPTDPLAEVPHSHPDGFPCLACGRDAAKAAVAAERKRIRAAVEGMEPESLDPAYVTRTAVLAIIDGADR